MVYVFFTPKIPFFKIFRKALWWKIVGTHTLRPLGLLYCSLVYFMAIWYALWPFGMLYGHLVCFMAIWYILLPFGRFCGLLV
jgi:hypothetical protein